MADELQQANTLLQTINSLPFIIFITTMQGIAFTFLALIFFQFVRGQSKRESLFAQVISNEQKENDQLRTDTGRALNHLATAVEAFETTAKTSQDTLATHSDALAAIAEGITSLKTKGSSPLQEMMKTTERIENAVGDLRKIVEATQAATEKTAGQSDNILQCLQTVQQHLTAAVGSVQSAINTTGEMPTPTAVNSAAALPAGNEETQDANSKPIGV